MLVVATAEVLQLLPPLSALEGLGPSHAAAALLVPRTHTIATNGDTSFAIHTDGTLWAVGDNHAGLLGQGTNGRSSDSSIPVQVHNLSSVVDIEVGYDNYTVAVEANGSVWAWGSGSSGEVGCTEPCYSFSPIQIAGLSNIVQVSAGPDYILALRSDGTVWSWGYDGVGQLGWGQPTDQYGDPYYYPYVGEVQGLSGVNITQVAATGFGIDLDTSLAVTSTGAVYAWGGNYSGNLGCQNSCPSGGYSEMPLLVSGISNAVQVAGGAQTAYVVLSNGTLDYWGEGLGAGTMPQTTAPNPILTNVASVSVPAYNLPYALALTNSGGVEGWGYGDSVGEMGDGQGATWDPSVYPSGKCDGPPADTQHPPAISPGSATPLTSGVSEIAAGSGANYYAGGGDTGMAVVNGTTYTWGYGWDQLALGAPVTTGCIDNVGALTIPYVDSPAASLFLNTASPWTPGPPPVNGPTGSELYGKVNAGELGGPFCMADTNVNCATGNLVDQADDLSVPGHGVALDMHRTYNSLAATSGASGPLGYGWSSPYTTAAAISGALGTAGTTVTITQGNGATVTFTSKGGSPTTFSAPDWVTAQLSLSTDGSQLNYTIKGDINAIFSAAAGQLLSLSDRYTYTTTLGYTNGQLTSVTDPEARALTFAYTSTGRIQTVTDPLGRQVTYGYDAAGNLATVKDLAGYTVTYGYNSAHQLISVIDGRGNQTLQVFYTASNQVDHIIDALGSTTSFGYTTSNGNQVLAVSPPLGGQYIYTVSHNKAVSIQKGVGTPQAGTWLYYYDQLGDVIGAFDPNNAGTRAQFDQFGNAMWTSDSMNRTTTYTYLAFPLSDVATVTDNLGNTTTRTYSLASQGQPWSGQLLSVTKPGQITTKYTYSDPNHPDNVMSSIDPNGQSWSYTYDSYGDKQNVTDPLSDTTSTTYDSIGRVKGTTDGNGKSTTITPDAFGRATSSADPLGQTTYTTYDGDGNVASVKDPVGNLTQYSYNAANQQTKATRPDGTQLTTTYDADGRLASQCDGKNNCTTYGYDGQGRATSVTDPKGRATRSSFDAAGRLLSTTDATNLTTTYAYNADNQVTSKTYNDGGKTPNVSYGYDGVGRRTSMSDGTGTTTYSYNSAGEVSQVTNGAGAKVQYGYDSRGAVTSITYPSLNSVVQGYDTAGRLSSIKDWDNLTTAYTYDKDSSIATITYPNGVLATYGHNNADVLTSITEVKGSTTLASFTYGRNADNQVSTSTVAGVPGGNDTYTYSPISQLATDNSAAYLFDPADNLTQIPTSTPTTLSYDIANELTSASGGASATYGYDNRGDRSSQVSGRTTTTYMFNQAGRMSSTSAGGSTSYTYNGDGVRTLKAAGKASESFTYDLTSGNLLVDSSNGATFVYGPTGPLEELVPGSKGSTTTYFYEQDQLGSTRLLTTATGAVANTYTYSPVGATTGSTGSAPNPLLFQGQYRDSETGFYYQRARYYDPASGQFVSRDPKVVSTRSPYGYVYGDPLNRIDPTGQWSLNLPFGLCLSFGNDPGCATVVNNSNLGQAVLTAAQVVAAVIPGADLVDAGAEATTFAIGDIADATVAADATGDVGSALTRSYQTYIKVNADTGEVYAGRTSGFGTPLENLAARDASHAYNDLGFGPAQLDQSSASYAAIRGREQQLIDYFDNLGNSANKINGISPLNPNYSWYMQSAVGEFGYLP